MEIDKYEGLLEKAKDFNNLRNGGIWRIVEELVGAVEDLLEENSFLATGKDSDKGFVVGWTAAIEAASDTEELYALVSEQSCGEWSEKDIDEDVAMFQSAIRAITPPADAAAALDRLTAQARAQGLREAAKILMERGFLIYDPIIDRAEEIEKELSNE